MPLFERKGPKKYSFFACFILLFLILVSFLSVTVIATPPPQNKSIEHHPRIETKLAKLSNLARESGPEAARLEASSSGIDITNSNLVDIVIEMKRGKTLDELKLKRLNGRVTGRAGSFYEVRIPISRVNRLPGNLSGVKFIRTPYEPRTLGVEYGTYLSEGVNLTGGSVFHSKNLLGQEVKIAVIDVGFASFRYAKAANEFPEGVVASKQDYTGEGIFTGSSHGTTVAEIVHDMAPSAKLYLKKIDTGVSLGNAVEDAISQNVDIIVHSIGWVNTNFGDGTGLIANQTKKAIEHGILWVNAAGNSAKKHWEGEARDQDNDGWVEFANGDETLTVKVKYPSTIRAFLTWNDWPKSDKDFDFYLYDAEGNLVSSSQNYQTGTESPAESITYSTGSANNYQLKVSVPEEFSRTSLEIFSFNHRLEPAVESSSVMAPGNVEKVFTVGAINRKNWKDGPIEYFSSRGPASDGIVKPDITAVDGVSTFLRYSFLGTSAAAPYVAGAAALVLSRAPNFTPKQIKEALYEHAQDLGSSGDDNIYGRGKMRLIYKTPSASRTIVRPQDGEVEPGDQFKVKVSARMPLTLQGGLTLREEVPEPFVISKIIYPSSAKISTKRTVEYQWPIVTPGTKKELSYRVFVPKDTPPGDYEFSGAINGNSMDASSATAVNIVSRTGADPGGNNKLVVDRVESIWDSFTRRVEFKVWGENVSEIKVIVYSTSGKLIFNSGWRPGLDYQWNLHDDQGDTVPNGIYISIVKIRGENGTIQSSGTNKTMVLR